MNRASSALLAAVVLFLVSSGSLHAQNCAAHLGGSWFVNCKSLVTYRGQNVVSFADWTDPIGSVELEVFSTKGVSEAQVRGGKLIKGDVKRFLLKASPEEFSLVDGSTDRIICILKKVPSTTKSATCQVDVWLDLYVSGAGYFHCEPGSSNDPTLEMLKGGAFVNSFSAISL